VSIVIACFGTVDILNMEYQSHDVKRAVDEISCAVGELKNICDRLHMKRRLFLQPVKRRWAWLRVMWAGPMKCAGPFS